MFLQKFKVGLRLLGVLLLRVLLGFVAGCLWMFAVAFIFHMAVGNPPISPPFGLGRLSVFEIVDYFYEEYYDPPREWRYQGTAGRFYPIALQVGLIGFWVWFVVGILWGFLQGRLDLRKWLRRKHA